MLLVNILVNAPLFDDKHVDYGCCIMMHAGFVHEDSIHKKKTLVHTLFHLNNFFDNFPVRKVNLMQDNKKGRGVKRK